jgi:hypothetical protein
MLWPARDLREHHAVRDAAAPVRTAVLFGMAPHPGPGSGDIAPDFSLRRTFEETVTLSALREAGPVVVAFYVFDFGNL